MMCKRPFRGHLRHGRFGFLMLTVVSILLTLPLIWAFRDIADSLRAIAGKPETEE